MPLSLSKDASLLFTETHGVAFVSRIGKKYMSLLQKSPIEESIFCKGDL